MAKERISKRLLQENKVHQIFQKKHYVLPPICALTWACQVQEMLVFRKMWRALFSCKHRFGIFPFTLLPTIKPHRIGSTKATDPIKNVGNSIVYKKQKDDCNCNHAGTCTPNNAQHKCMDKKMERDNNSSHEVINLTLFIWAVWFFPRKSDSQE